MNNTLLPPLGTVSVEWSASAEIGGSLRLQQLSPAEKGR